jgi:hypothetical protein
LKETELSPGIVLERLGVIPEDRLEFTEKKNNEFTSI